MQGRINQPFVDPTFFSFKELIRLIEDPGHEAIWSHGVTCLATSSGNQILASGGADRTVKLWDVVTGRNLRTLVGHKDSIVSLAISRDGRTVYSVAWDSLVKELDHVVDRNLAIREWDINTGSLLQTVPEDEFNYDKIANKCGESQLLHHEDLCSISCDGNLFVKGNEKGGRIEVQDAHSGTQITSFIALPNSADFLFVIALSPDGQILATAGTDRKVRLWDVQTGILRQEWDSQCPGVRSFCFLHNRGWIATGGNDGSVKVWDIRSETLVWAVTGCVQYVASLGTSQAGHPVSLIRNPETVVLYDTTLRQQVATLPVKIHFGRKVAWSLGESLLAVQNQFEHETGGHVTVWNTTRGTLVCDLGNVPSPISTLTFVPRKHLLVAGTTRGVVLAWDLATREARPFPSLGNDLELVIIHASCADGQGKRVYLCVELHYTASANRHKLSRMSYPYYFHAILAWDLESQALSELARGDVWSCDELLFSISGQFLMVRKSNAICIAPLDAIAHPRLLEHCDFEFFTCGAVSPDGLLVAAGGFLGVVRIWRPDGSIVGICVHPRVVRSVLFLPDNCTLVTTTDGGEFRSWHIPHINQ